MAIINCSTHTTASTCGRTFSLIALVILVALAGFAAGERTLAAPQQRLAVYATSVAYNNPDYDSLVVIEFPFSLSRAGLEFFRPDSADTAYYGRVYAQVVLFDSSAYPFDSASTYFSVRVDNPSEAESSGVMLFDVLGMVVPPGRYTANLTVIDVVSKRSGDVFLNAIVAEAPQRQRLDLAGPRLAYKISKVADSAQAANDRLVRHGLRILTNPTGTFSITDSLCYFYAELYNLSAGPAGAKYRVQYTILDSTGGIVQEFGFAERAKPGKSAVLVESFDISTLSPALYYLRAIVTDPASGQSDSAAVQLRRMEPRQFALEESAAGVTDPFDSLSVEERLRVTRYLLDPVQLEIVLRLPDEGKANFLEQYWREHDINPSTRAVENRTEMVRRFEYANRNFSRLEGRVDGWQSDRGRIYMLWGPWEDRRDVPAPRVGAPFSIWYYRSFKEGKYFVFEDITGDNEYKLVHSNADGEPRNADWELRIKEEMLELR